MRSGTCQEFRPCIRKSASQEFPILLTALPHLPNGTRLGYGKWIGRMIERANKCRSRRIKPSPSSRVVRQGAIKGGDEKLIKKTGRAISCPNISLSDLSGEISPALAAYRCLVTSSSLSSFLSFPPSPPRPAVVSPARSFSGALRTCHVSPIYQSGLSRHALGAKSTRDETRRVLADNRART
jgi:hypothetical protein